MLLLALACTGAPVKPPPADTDEPVAPACPDEDVLTIAVNGFAGSTSATVAGLLDASTWRLGDATPLTTVTSRNEGLFTLCLTTDPTVTRLYEMALWAAWVDADADGRLDAMTEPLCDRSEDGALLDPLYFEDGAWRVGLGGTPGGALSPTVAVDGDACSL